MIKKLNFDYTMVKINKDYNLRIINIIVSIMLLFSDPLLHASSIRKESLRVPLRGAGRTKSAVNEDAIVEQLLQAPHIAENILEGIGDADKKRLIQEAVNILNRQIRKTTPDDYATNFENYLCMLKILCIKGHLKELIVYPAIGIDVIPAQLRPVLGINMRDFVHMIYREMMRKPDIYKDANISVMRQNLSYRSPYNVLEIETVDRLLSSLRRGCSITLMLKGIGKLRIYSFNPSWIRRTGEKEIFSKYLQPLCDRILKAEDTIVLFDEDIKFLKFFIRTGEYERIDSGICRSGMKYPRGVQPFIDGYLSGDVLEFGTRCVVLRKVDSYRDTASEGEKTIEGLTSQKKARHHI